jgi:hypothetical protein
MAEELGELDSNEGKFFSPPLFFLSSPAKELTEEKTRISEKRTENLDIRINT